MALKKTNAQENVQADDSVTLKARALFNEEPEVPARKKTEKMVLTTFSIKPSEKKELEEFFLDQYGVGWSAGIRIALKEFIRKHKENE